MIPLQEVNFHLTSGEVIFAQLIATGNGGFSATVTEPYSSGQIPVEKFFRWLPCPSGADASAAFKEVATAIANYASKKPGNSIDSVNNPCNCEFVAPQLQQSILGPGAKVLVNGAQVASA